MAWQYRRLHHAHHGFWHKGDILLLDYKIKVILIQKEVWANVSTEQSWWHVQELTVCTVALTEVAPIWGIWVALSILCTFPQWTDDEYVTGYGVQVLGWYDGNYIDCLGTTQDLRATGSVDFPNKVYKICVSTESDRARTVWQWLVLEWDTLIAWTMFIKYWLYSSVMVNVSYDNSIFSLRRTYILYWMTLTECFSFFLDYHYVMCVHIG